jgi:hypothetical protein
VKRLLISGSVTLAALVFASSMASRTQAKTSCHLINAKAAGQNVGGGVNGDGSIYILTSAKIIGGGLLHGGTIDGRLTIIPPLDIVTPFVERLTFTTQHGALVINELKGMVNFATHSFNAAGDVTDATGRLSGATGHIAVSGVIDEETSTFTEDLSGYICVDLTP